MLVYQRLCQNVMWPFSMDSVYSNLCSHPTIQIVPQKFVAKLADNPVLRRERIISHQFANLHGAAVDVATGPPSGP